MRPSPRLRAALVVLVLAVTPASSAAALAPSAGAVRAAAYESPPEPYAQYRPQTRCRAHARPGTVRLARFVNRQFDGGRARATVRGCSSGGVSEHKDGRAIDWSMDATTAADRREVRRFLDRIFRTDPRGHRHAPARRMGVMYVIWNDRMWASYERFDPKPYRISSCPRVRTCSPTARHRDHVHISLSRRGARGDTSWYAGRL